MSDFVARFKRRVVAAPSFDVKVGSVTFKIPRIAEMEKIGARQDAASMLRKEGIDPTSSTRPQHADAIAYSLALANVLKKYVIGWEFDGTEAIPFHPSKVTAMIDDMDEIEKIQLVNEYARLEAEDLKNVAGGALPSSGNGSAGQ